MYKIQILFCVFLSTTSLFAMENIDSNNASDENKHSIHHLYDPINNVHFIGTNHQVTTSFVKKFSDIINDQQNERISLVVEGFQHLYADPDEDPLPEMTMIFDALKTKDPRQNQEVDEVINGFWEHVDSAVELARVDDEVVPDIFEKTFQPMLAQHINRLKECNPRFEFYVLDSPRANVEKKSKNSLSPLSVDELNPYDIVNASVFTVGTKVLKIPFWHEMVRQERELEFAVLERGGQNSADVRERETRWNWFGTLECAMKERSNPKKHAIVVVVGAAHISFMNDTLFPFMDSVVNKGMINPVHVIREMGEKGTVQYWLDVSTRSREFGNDAFKEKKNNQAFAFYIEAFLQARVALILAHWQEEAADSARERMVAALNNVSLLSNSFGFAVESMLVAQLGLHLKPNARGIQRWAQAKQALGVAVMPSDTLTWLLTTSLALGLSFEEGLSVAKDLKFSDALIAEHRERGAEAYKNN